MQYLEDLLGQPLRQQLDHDHQKVQRIELRIRLHLLHLQASGGPSWSADLLASLERFSG